MFLGVLVLIAGIGIGLYWQQGQSGGITPDSVWWTLDRIGEWIELNLLTWDQAGRLELYLAFMQERIDELADLDRLGKLTGEYADQIQNHYASLAELALQSIEERARREVDAKTEAVLQKVGEVVERQQKSLTELLVRMPEQAEPMKHTFVTVQSAYQQAVDLFKKEN